MTMEAHVARTSVGRGARRASDRTIAPAGAYRQARPGGSTAEPQGFDVSRVYTLRGSLRFTVRDKTGQVTVTSSF